ncbi:MAG: 4Fe-4S binding protein [Coriobacteriales bacterium]|nr:4Fe-4S binding protein [Coriobacteriales bacterium]
MKKLKANNLRAIVILGVVLVIAVGYFNLVGIGNLSDFGWGLISTICPLGFVETLLASKLLIPRAVISFFAVVAIVIVLGRVFCAWVCPVPLLQRWFPGSRKQQEKRIAEALPDAEALPAATEALPDAEALPAVDLLDEPSGDLPVQAALMPAETKLKLKSAAKPKLKGAAKPNNFKLDSRHVVLGGALLSTAIFGFPVFCLVCPVGLTFASVLFLMRLFAFGETTWTILVFPLVLVLELVFFRKWCKTICPLGALMSLISGLNKTFRPSIDNSRCIKTAQGVNCSACSAVCAENIDIRNPKTSQSSLNNCTKCRNCSDICPAHAISFPFLKGKQKTED